MKRFIININLFLLPVWVAVILLVCIPANKRRSYYYLNNDCEGRGAWIYSRIFQSNQPVDVAFLGSSHTINGINDSLITDLASMQACNLGYCRLGRDLTYVLLKDLIQIKKTKYFVIEVLPEESPFSHPVFPFVADGIDLVNPQIAFNRSFLPNLHKGILARLKYCQDDLFGEQYEYKYPLNGKYGFTTNTFSADTSSLNSLKYRRQKARRQPIGFEGYVNKSFSRSWLNDIHLLAKRYHCKIVFLYLPAYGVKAKQPLDSAFLLNIGDIWIPPDSIFNNMSNWYDGDHLNLQGANLISEYIAEKLRE